MKSDAGQARSGGRQLLSLLAIALGVAMGYAIQLINTVAIAEMTQAAQAMSGEADLVLRGASEGFDEMLYPLLAKRPEVALASPVVEFEFRLAPQAEPSRSGGAGVVVRGGVLPVQGVDMFRAAALQPMLAALSSPGGDGLDVLRPAQVFLSQSGADWLGLQAGETLQLQRGLRTFSLRVAGLLPAEVFRQRIAVMDIAAAQDFLALESESTPPETQSGRLQRIDLRLRSGIAVEAFKSRMQPLLPEGVWLELPQSGAERVSGLSRSYRVNLNVLALVALFTGGLLVFSSQVLSVVRRRAPFALLRVLGMTRRELARLVLFEALRLGAAGAALGLLLGYLLASALIARFGADLGAGHFNGLLPQLQIEPWAALLFFALGVLVSVLGSIAPAMEAAAAAPARALRAGSEQAVFLPLAPPWPGLLLVGVGALLTQAPPWNGLPLPGYIAIALLLVGSILLMPRLALLVFGALQRRVGDRQHAAPAPRAIASPTWLALQQLAGAPGQAMLSLASIVASVSLMVSMAIMVASFRTSLEHWLDQILPADLYLRTGSAGDSAFLSPAVQRQMAGLPGLQRVEFLHSQRLLIDPQQPALLLLARDVEPGQMAQVLPVMQSLPSLQQQQAAQSNQIALWASEAVAERYQWQPGRQLQLPLFPGQQFYIAGVWRDYARQQGALLMARADWLRLGGDASASEAGFWLTPGASLTQLRQALRDLPGAAALDIAAPGEIRAASLAIFDRTFAVTYALEAVAVLLGLAGLSASFGALVLARRREFGMLRHIGMTRRQISAMLAREGLLVSALGLCVGLLLGWLISLVMIHVVNRQSFHWSMEVYLPWGNLLLFALGLLTLATLTAVLSGRQAMTGDAVRAVREDW